MSDSIPAMRYPDPPSSPARPRTNAQMALLAAVLMVLFLGQILFAVHGEVMTNDEGYHTYAGLRYWQCGDFGVNPEHPPLAKIVAALPLHLFHTPFPATPCPVLSTNKGVGYGESDDWLYGTRRNPASVDVDQVLWRARLSVSLFALTLAVMAFFFTRRLFGDSAGLAALALIVFEPTLIAHGVLVTTDMALSAMSLLAVFTFYVFHRHRSWLSLLAAGVCCGLCLSVKHSGVLILPVLIILAISEFVSGWRNRDKGTGSVASPALRCVGSLAAVFAIGFLLLWATYHFRYAARPDGAALSLPLADFIAQTTAQGNRSLMLKIIPTLARLHLPPEAYLYGFVDVLSISNPGQSSYLLGHLYPHGVPWYFPAVVLLKSTVGMIGLGVLALLGIFHRRVTTGLRSMYLLAPATVWMLGGMISTLNIGYRHVLPIIAPACCLIGAAAVALWEQHGRRYRLLIAVFFAMHITSSLASFPNEMAYGNEVAGGVTNSPNLLTDSNNDWSQALPQLAVWLRTHHAEDCWLAYDGMARPAHAGVPCHPLIANEFGVPNKPPPAILSGTVVISGLSLSGIEWERPDLNPYQIFRDTKPTAVIGGADMIYQGTFDMGRVVAVHQIIQAMTLSNEGRYADALPLAQAAVATLPTSGLAHLQLANALKGLGHRNDAHAEYVHAEAITDAQPEWYFLQRPEIQAGMRETLER